jgi:hypothetical protein
MTAWSKHRGVARNMTLARRRDEAGSRRKLWREYGRGYGHLQLFSAIFFFRG